VSVITILGTGLMSKALGSGWTRAGHSVRIGTRDVKNASAAKLGFEPAFVGTPAEAVDGARFVVLAIPFPEVTPTVTALRGALKGKIVIDISNPFDHLAHNERAAAEFTADALGGSDGLVAAFKDNFAATINAGGAERPDVKIAGDDEAAKTAVAELASDLGLRSLDCGPLHNARFIDGMVSLMLILDRAYCDFTMKTGWRFLGIPHEATTATERDL
jgi:predicted dinucleotide-binding enzyme